MNQQPQRDCGVLPRRRRRVAFADNPQLGYRRLVFVSYKALLWDNDGVLVDTEQWYFQSTREVLAEVRIDLTEALYFEHFLASANGISYLAAPRGFSEIEIEKLRRDRNERYQYHLEHQPLVIPGVRETLRALRPHFTMGIVTSSRRSHFETIHRRTGFLEFFDFAITADDCENCKPAPDPYLQAIARSGFPMASCLAIEDAPRGLAAARAAGLDCWIVPTTLSRYADFSGATRILSGVTEVASLLSGAREKSGDDQPSKAQEKNSTNLQYILNDARQ